MTSRTNRWIARFRHPSFPGDYSRFAGLTLRMQLVNAGKNSDRSVDVRIDPMDLEMLAALISKAIEARDGTNSMLS